MNKPNFFLIGAPRCATTAMCQYLDRHPSIYISKPKEPNFFDGDLLSLKPLHRSYTLQEYLDLFKAGEGLLCGEGTVWYMLSRTAARDIYQFNPNAKILIMLRNPVDFLHSLHSHLVFYGYEDIQDFESALQAEPDRRQGKRIPGGCNPTELLLYSELVSFSEQIQRYLDVFDQSQIHVTIYDDFVKDTAGTYRKVLEFLGVDANFVTDFEVVNSNKRSGNAIEPKLRQQLQSQYTQEVKKLSGLLDRDLSFWSKAHDSDLQKASTQTVI
ncbi:sulfotransferase family protein [Floridanema aerugineum]|uniref:Sulfotransferase n=1 Tax=Floridaenema aerugineum BLCC-F46 TaxID=3153654 RepID=A0ABV4X8I9_9CYAN